MIGGVVTIQNETFSGGGAVRSPEDSSVNFFALAVSNEGIAAEDLENLKQVWKFNLFRKKDNFLTPRAYSQTCFKRGPFKIRKIRGGDEVGRKVRYLSREGSVTSKSIKCCLGLCLNLNSTQLPTFHMWNTNPAS